MVTECRIITGNCSYRKQIQALRQFEGVVDQLVQGRNVE
jgi:hypothetical protein